LLSAMAGSVGSIVFGLLGTVHACVGDHTVTAPAQWSFWPRLAATCTSTLLARLTLRHHTALAASKCSAMSRAGVPTSTFGSPNVLPAARTDCSKIRCNPSEVPPTRK
jgi:hypothetical protein